MHRLSKGADGRGHIKPRSNPKPAGPFFARVLGRGIPRANSFHCWQRPPFPCAALSKGQDGGKCSRECFLAVSAQQIPGFLADQVAEHIVFRGKPEAGRIRPNLTERIQAVENEGRLGRQSPPDYQCGWKECVIDPPACTDPMEVFIISAKRGIGQEPLLEEGRCERSRECTP